MSSVKIPSEIRQGDTIKFRDVATQDNLGNTIDSTWTLEYSIRTDASGNGVTTTAAAYGDGWETTLSSGTTGSMLPGTWYWQATAYKGTDVITLGSGQTKVLVNLHFSGTANAYDGRSQAEKDLADVEAAIRAIAQGGASKEYRIGGRQLKRYDMGELLVLKSQLKAEIVREKKQDTIRNGLGNPHNLFIRFGK